jgi:LytS/YehU family sensor histidine kinase
VVAGPLIAAQAWFSRMSPSATGLAVVMVALFLAIAPASWRWLFPPDLRPGWSLVPRIAGYVVLGGLPALLAFVVPDILRLESTFLGTWINALVSAALFWVGGWGLARDIEQERAVSRQTARADAAIREAERAQLLAVRSNLDPHFLFNTLNAIAEWTREDPEVAEKAILRLSGVLREVLSGIHAETWPLGRELALVRDVWELHRIRDPGWFTVRWDVDDPPPAFEVPPMILLPLAENAVKHGPAKGRRGELGLRATVEGGALRVEIRNPGEFSGPRPGSAGLPMVEKRLALAYGAGASVAIGPDRGATTVVLEIGRSK